MFRRLSENSQRDFASNFLLFFVVILTWTYTIIAGKHLSERYLNSLDLPLDQMKQFDFQNIGKS